MYYLIGKSTDSFNAPSYSHVFDVSCSRGKILESLQELTVKDQKDGETNIRYTIIETNGKEFHEEFFKTFSIFYEKEAILQTKSISDYIKGKSKEDEEDYEGSALEIIDTIGAGISPLKDLQDHLYFLIEELLKDEEVAYRGANYIVRRLRSFLKTFDTLIETVIDTLNDAIDLTEKRDGKG